MTVYDVSFALREGMPVWPGEAGPRLHFHSLVSRGDVANISSLSLGSHTGTHVDAPHHFIDGAPTVDMLPPESLVGPAHVVEHRGLGDVTAAHLHGAGLPADAVRLLLKTPSGGFWEEPGFRPDYVALAEDAARWLVERGFVLVGIDYLSIERYQPGGYAVHRTLLEAGIVVAEGLDLRAVKPGRYWMCCAPLKTAGADGAPARVFLWDE